VSGRDTPQRTAALVAERGERRASGDDYDGDSTQAVPSARWTPGDMTPTVDEDDEESEDAWNLTDRGGRERY
jgi:S-DNA-T family DNA segregation ATPase FtsK/SpoIIIE